MITDPVYEGKSMQGMIDLTRKGGVPEGSKVLHAHLGGAPASNGYSDHYKAGYRPAPRATKPSARPVSSPIFCLRELP